MDATVKLRMCVCEVGGGGGMCETGWMMATQIHNPTMTKGTLDFPAEKRGAPTNEALRWSHHYLLVLELHHDTRPANLLPCTSARIR